MNNLKLVELVATAAKAAPAAAKLKKATQEIEAIFVKDLMAAMRRTAKHQSLGNSFGGDMYQDMFDQALSETTAKTGTLGIAQTIFRQMAPTAIRAALGSASDRRPNPTGILPSGSRADAQRSNAPSVPESRLANPGQVPPDRLVRQAMKRQDFETGRGPDALATREQDAPGTKRP